MVCMAYYSNYSAYQTDQAVNDTASLVANGLEELVQFGRRGKLLRCPEATYQMTPT